MPFLLAEILNFQGSTHHIGVGSFSNLNDITDADDYEDTISTITASLEKLRNEEDPLYVLLELIAGDNEELVDFYFKMVGFH